MHKDHIKAVFNQQALGYESQQAKLTPIREGLFFLLESVFADLPIHTRVLCVGVGTGEEVVYLAKKFPTWRFTVVEPSGAMLEICRQKAENGGFFSRCYFHEGFLDSLPDIEKHEAATCFMVSQFILKPEERSAFFRTIASHLHEGGILASSDLSSDVGSAKFNSLFHAWMNMLFAAEVPPEAIERTRAAWAKDVAILPPDRVELIIEAGGFNTPIQFYQAGLIHAWYSLKKLAPNIYSTKNA